MSKRVISQDPNTPPIKVAIYTRKSKQTEHGESIHNQIDMCRDYAYIHFNCKEDGIFIYEDEGFSGSNVNRPAFAKLTSDIRNKKIDAVICYRLDRISRNVVDFSSVLEMLNKHGVAFVSITEHFDTSTPMGRAMIYISSVFAQLERETIAERIRDNMRRLARTGRYIGSTPPMGFKSETVEYTDLNGNKKKMHKLTVIEEDMAYVKLVYEKYIELASLSKVETWLMQSHRKNKNGNYSGTAELRRMLTNPVYVRANDTVYEYYTKLGSDVVNAKDEFRGGRGMFIYGRHDRNKHCYQPSGWTVVLAEHTGVIDADIWLSVQRQLEFNKGKAPRAGTSKNALLTSKMRCGHCGGTMVIIYGVNHNNYYYKCRNKIKSRGKLCSIRNVNGREADEEIYYYLKNLSEDKAKFAKALSKHGKKLIANKDEIIKEGLKIREDIKDKTTEIKNMTMQLRNNKASTAAKYIIADIEALNNELEALQKQLLSIGIQEQNINDYEIKKELTKNTITDFVEIPDYAPLEFKRKFIDKIIDTIIWNEKELYISFR